MSEQLVREYERIIDHGYRSFPVFSLPVEEAAYAVLAAFDCHILTEIEVRRHSEDDSLSIPQVQLFKFLGEGFSLAMRWLLGNCDSVDVHPNPRPDLPAIGNELIQYGADYYRASIMYSAYSQGRMDALVFPEDRRVRFSHKPEIVSKQPIWGFAEEASREMLKNTPAWRKQKKQRQSQAVTVFRRVPHRFQDGRIFIEDVSLLCDDRVRRGLEPGMHRHFILSRDIDLGGFRVADFDAFWRALHTWSVCATDLYLNAFDHLGIPQEQAMPTQVVPREMFIRSMGVLSGLTSSVVEAIARRLTVDHRTNKLDMYLQPFLCGPNYVAWSVRAVQLSISQRNLLKLMARTPSDKALADDIIGGRERDLVASLAKRLENKGWTVATFKDLPGQEEGEVDLIGWNWTYPAEILIVEVKAVLQADDPNEVRAATREMKHAQAQLERIIQVIYQLPQSVKQSWIPGIDWPNVTRWSGMVITPEGEPGLDFDHSKYPACSFATLEARLSAKDWRSPSRCGMHW